MRFPSPTDTTRTTVIQNACTSNISMLLRFGFQVRVGLAWLVCNAASGHTTRRCTTDSQSLTDASPLSLSLSLSLDDPVGLPPLLHQLEAGSGNDGRYPVVGRRDARVRPLRPALLQAVPRRAGGCVVGREG